MSSYSLIKPVADKFNGSFKEYLPFSKASCRSAYENLSADVKAEVIREGEEFLDYKYPSISATDYMAFLRTGNRTDFERVYFYKRAALVGCCLAECVEHKGRFTDLIVNGIFSICEESGWQLPPHNSYKRGEKQYILPDSFRPVLDLFACETGALLATVLYCLKDELDEISPFITKRIKDELDRRIIKPYLSEHFWWMGMGDEPMCNWTPWCTENVLLCAFLTDYDEETRKNIFKKAAASCDFFLKDYGDDGCCDEGAQYFKHAGLCLYKILEIFNTITDGFFSDVCLNKKIVNISRFILNVHAEGKYYFNFADCAAVAGRAGVREFMFGKLTGQKDIMMFSSRDVKASGVSLYTDDVNRANLFMRLENCFFRDEVLSFEDEGFIPSPDVYYESVGIFISRNKDFELAVKSGDNDDSHNHNDTGSFILYNKEHPVFVDLGVESYTAKTFSEDRYDIWTMRSEYHNLPTIEGKGEEAGASYKASDVKVSLSNNETDTNPSISMELIKAFPELSKTKSYKRKVVFNKDSSEITLTDSTDSDDYQLNFITYDEPKKVAENLFVLGDNVKCTISNIINFSVESLPITDERLKGSWDKDLYRLILTPKGNLFTMKISTV